MTDHVKQSYVRTKENIMQSTEKSSDRENNPVGYAEDVASEYADRIFHETVIIPGLSEPPVRTLRATIPENESHIFR